MKYCVHCGKQIFDEAVICTGCGCPVQPKQQYQQHSSVPRDILIKTVSERFNTNGIIWLVIACLQIIVGIFWFWWTLIIGVLNLIFALQDMNYAKNVLHTPGDILEKVRSLVGPIITLIYNLVFGGIIGVAGNIYYLVAVRGYVMENEAAFEQIAMESIRNTTATASKATVHRTTTEQSAPVPPVPSLTCPACGKTQFANAKICFNCGTPLQSQADQK